MARRRRRRNKRKKKKKKKRNEEGDGKREADNKDEKVSDEETVSQRKRRDLRSIPERPGFSWGALTDPNLRASATRPQPPLRLRRAGVSAALPAYREQRAVDALLNAVWTPVTAGLSLAQALASRSACVRSFFHAGSNTRHSPFSIGLAYLSHFHRHWEASYPF